MDVIYDGFRSLMYWLATLIYRVIIYLYDIFDLLCHARVLDHNTIGTMAERIGIILAVVMLFMTIFSVVQMLLEPDKLTDKEKGVGNIVKKIFLVIILLGTSQFIFRFMYGAQQLILDSGIITQIILPYELNDDAEAKFGNILASNLFTSFYRLTDEATAPDTCKYAHEQLAGEIANDGTFNSGEICINEKVNNEYVMDLDALLLPVAGAVCVYFILSYCFSVGMRTFQLAFLEIISPMAIVANLSPKKETMFQKWLKIYISTYIDVFLRIAIITVIVFLIGVIFDTNLGSVLIESVTRPDGTVPSGTTGLILNTFLILALLMFAKKAPDLIKELWPASASKLGLGPMDLRPSKLMDNMFGAKALKSLTGNTVGLLGKKTLAGFDAKLHGEKFSDGFKTPKGKLGTWLDKQRESYLPNYNKDLKARHEGSREVEQINTKWQKGIEIGRKLMNAGAGNAKSTTNPWTKVLNGQTANRSYYEAIFSSKMFIDSKMEVDKESKIEDTLRQANQQIMAGGSYTYNGITYSNANGNIADFADLYETQQKKVEGLKAVHDSMRKQYSKDAATEDRFKFIKNNQYNPTNTKQDRDAILE